MGPNGTLADTLVSAASFSLGNILYTILTGHFPFDDLEDSDTKKAKLLVQKGKRPHVNIDADIRNSEDPYEQAMLTAVEMCWKQDPHDRASAREVQAVLADFLPRGHDYPARRAKGLRRSLH